MAGKKKRNGRLENAVVKKREQFVFDYAKAHVKATAKEINDALGPKFDNIPMRNIRIYEIAKAARNGAAHIPPVKSGKRPSKRKATSSGAQMSIVEGGAQAAPAGPAQRRGTPSRSPTHGQESAAVERAVRDLQEAGLENIHIDYTVKKHISVA